MGGRAAQLRGMEVKALQHVPVITGEGVRIGV